jgi:hypothetical protein
MAALALTAVGLLSGLVFVLFGALIELYRDVRQLREAAGILDRPLSIDIGAVAHAAPSSVGLPPALDAAASAIVLFLSDKCATCRVLAAALDTVVPPGVCVVMEAGDVQSATRFLNAYGLTPEAAGGMVCLDTSREIADRLGLDVTPVAFRVENGKLASATTVPSARYLFSILPAPLKLEKRSQSWSTPWSRTLSSHTTLAHGPEPGMADF